MPSKKEEKRRKEVERLISNHFAMLRMRKHRAKKKSEKMCAIAWANARETQTPADWNQWDVILPDDDKSFILWGKVSRVSPRPQGRRHDEFYVEMMDKGCHCPEGGETKGKIMFSKIHRQESVTQPNLPNPGTSQSQSETVTQPNLPNPGTSQSQSPSVLKQAGGVGYVGPHPASASCSHEHETDNINISVPLVKDAITSTNATFEVDHDAAIQCDFIEAHAEVALPGDCGPVDKPTKQPSHSRTVTEGATCSYNISGDQTSVPPSHSFPVGEQVDESTSPLSQSILPNTNCFSQCDQPVDNVTVSPSHSPTLHKDGETLSRCTVDQPGDRNLPCPQAYTQAHQLGPSIPVDHNEDRASPYPQVDPNAQQPSPSEPVDQQGHLASPSPPVDPNAQEPSPSEPVDQQGHLASPSPQVDTQSQQLSAFKSVYQQADQQSVPTSPSAEQPSPSVSVDQEGFSATPSHQVANHAEQLRPFVPVDQQGHLASPSPPVDTQAQQQSPSLAVDQQGDSASPSHQVANHAEQLRPFVPVDQQGHLASPSPQVDTQAQQQSPSLAVDQQGDSASPSHQVATQAEQLSPFVPVDQQGHLASPSPQIDTQAQQPSPSLAVDQKGDSAWPTHQVANKAEPLSHSVPVDQQDVPAWPIPLVDTQVQPVNTSVPVDQQGDPALPSVPVHIHVQQLSPSVPVDPALPSPLLDTQAQQLSTFMAVDQQGDPALPSAQVHTQAEQLNPSLPVDQQVDPALPGPRVDTQVQQLSPSVPVDQQSKGVGNSSLHSTPSFPQSSCVPRNEPLTHPTEYEHNNLPSPSVSNSCSCVNDFHGSRYNHLGFSGTQGIPSTSVQNSDPDPYPPTCTVSESPLTAEDSTTGYRSRHNGAHTGLRTSANEDSEKSALTYVEVVMAPPATEFVGTFCSCMASTPSAFVDLASLHSGQTDQCRQSFIVLSNTCVNPGLPLPAALQEAFYKGKDANSDSPPKKKRNIRHVYVSDGKIDEFDTSQSKYDLTYTAHAVNLKPRPPTPNSCGSPAKNVHTCGVYSKHSHIEFVAMKSSCSCAGQEPSTGRRSDNEAEFPISTSAHDTGVSFGDADKGQSHAIKSTLEYKPKDSLVGKSTNPAFESLTKSFHKLSISSVQSDQTAKTSNGTFQIQDFLKIPPQKKGLINTLPREILQRGDKKVLIATPRLGSGGHTSLCHWPLKQLAATPKTPVISSNVDGKTESCKSAGGDMANSTPEEALEASTDFPLNECPEENVHERDLEDGSLKNESESIGTPSFDNVQGEPLEVMTSSPTDFPLNENPEQNVHERDLEDGSLKNDSESIGTPSFDNVQGEPLEVMTSSPHGGTETAVSATDDPEERAETDDSRGDSIVDDSSYSPEEGPETDEEDVDIALYDESSTDPLESLPDLDIDVPDLPADSENSSCQVVKWYSRLGSKQESVPGSTDCLSVINEEDESPAVKSDEGSEVREASTSMSLPFTQAPLPSTSKSPPVTNDPPSGRKTSSPPEETSDPDSVDVFTDDPDTPTSDSSFVSAKCSCCNPNGGCVLRAVLEFKASVPTSPSPLQLSRPPLRPAAQARVMSWLKEAKPR